MECDCMCIMYNLLRFFVDSFLNIDIIILRILLFCMNGWLNICILFIIRWDIDLMDLLK